MPSKNQTNITLTLEELQAIANGENPSRPQSTLTGFDNSKPNSEISSVLKPTVSSGIEAGGGIGSLGGEAGVLLSDGSIIAEGAAIPEGLQAVGSAPLPPSGFLGNAAPAAGITTAVINGVDAGQNLIKGDAKGKLEGGLTLAGTAAGAYLGGPVGAGIGSIAGRTVGRGAGWLGKKLGAFDKSTKEYERERWTDAANKGANDVDKTTAAQFFSISHPEGDDEIFDEGALKGRKYNWEEVSQVSSGKDVWGSLGFFQAFPNWISGFTPQEREAIANAALDNGLLTSNKGDLIFADENIGAIQEIAAQVKAGTFEPAKTAEQRWADKQAYLQQLADTEGYISEDLGKPFSPEEVAQPDVAQSQTATDVQTTKAQQQRRPQRPDLPTPSVEQPLHEPPPPPEPPPIKTAQEYSDAYTALLNRFSSVSTNPFRRSF